MSNTASLTTFAARFKTGRNSSAPAFLFISNSDRILLTKRLALILRSGMPLTESLLVLQSESRSRSLTYILSSIIRDVALGKTLSNALSKFPRQFNPFLTQIIAMGEASGTLSENLDFLSLELLRRARIKRMVLGALAYPLLILSVTIGVTVLLTVSIFPKVMPIFQSLHGTLPLTTRLLISTSLFLKDDGIALASFLIALILASVVIIKKVPRAKRFWQWCIFYTPLVGVICQLYNTSLFARTLARLLQARVPLESALKLIRESSHNTLYAALFAKMRARVLRGGGIAEVSSAGNLIQPFCSQLIGAGERTGTLQESLSFIADMQEEELRDRITHMTQLLEPLLMIIMGTLVGFVALSIISPIYSLSQNLTGN